jgi:hypothetical protein
MIQTEDTKNDKIMIFSIPLKDSLIDLNEMLIVLKIGLL